MTREKGRGFSYTRVHTAMYLLSYNMISPLQDIALHNYLNHLKNKGCRGSFYLCLEETYIKPLTRFFRIYKMVTNLNHIFK